MFAVTRQPLLHACTCLYSASFDKDLDTALCVSYSKAWLCNGSQHVFMTLWEFIHPFTGVAP